MTLKYRWHKRLAWSSTAFLIAAIMTAPLHADYFFGDQSADISRARWQFSLGAGWSIPLGVHEIIPGTQNTVVLGNWFGGEYRSTSSPFPATLRQGTSFDTSLFYSASPWLSIGMLGGVTTNQKESAAGPDVNLSVTWFGTSGGVVTPFTDGWGVRYGLSLSRAVPSVRVGPWMSVGALQIRPYVTAGAGWYKVDQYAAVTLPLTDGGEWDWRYFDKTDEYAGGMGGAGLTIALGEHGSATLEARYERVFSPGPKLQFFTPALELGYHFGD